MKFEDMDKPKTREIPVGYAPKQPTAPVGSPRPYKEPEPAEMNLGILRDNLGHCLGMIDDEVMKGYVTRLDRLPIIRTEAGFGKDFNAIHFFKISELVYQEDEFSVDKLGMVFHALSNRPCTLVLMLKSDGEQTDFYLGARPEGNRSAGTLFQMLKQSLMGFFPGSRISEYYDEDMKRDMRAMKAGSISSVTCVADYKQESDAVTNKEFIQGLEKFVYAMQGKSYTAVLIADNVSHDALMRMKREYEQIYTQISPFADMQMNFSVSDGGSASVGNSEGRTASVTRTQTEGISVTETETETHTAGRGETIGTTDTDTDTDTHTLTESEADGRTHTVGTADETSRTVTDGVNAGMHIGGFVSAGASFGPVQAGGGMSTGLSGGISHSVANGISHTDSVSDSISKTLTHGFSDSHGHSRAHSDSRSRSASESDSAAHGISAGRSRSAADAVGEAFSFVDTKTLTESFGTSRGITLNARNMTLQLVLQRIEKQLGRIEECESFGMWNFAAYFLGETAAETETAANTYKSVIAGNDSGIERSAIHSWSDEESVACLMPYVENFRHPLFVYAGFSYEGARYMAVNPSALISTRELAIHMGFPRRSVRGLPVLEHAAFAQEVIASKADGDAKAGQNICIGNIYHLGQKTGTCVGLDLNRLAMHTFVAGSTGSGKSNAVYHILSEARKRGIPFLVVEPAKGEYKDIFPDVRCLGTNPKYGELLKMNPFSFPREIHVLEHIDRIVEIFNVCWPMYAAMPAVLKESVEQAYLSAGWDLDLSENVKVEGLFPTFDDVLRELDAVISRSDYSADTKSDYVGALSTRLRSLTNGINGRIFGSDEMDLGDLFDRNAIVDISRVGAMETRSLVMGFVVLKLQEYRMSHAGERNVPLKHLTILEEAHNLLKKTSTEQYAESSNMAGKSVEMLTNAIAEMRTFGEGFIIVDQAPNLLDTAVIRNTNTKIVLRLPESADREIMGGAMALKEGQHSELSKLPTGVAAIYQNDWQEAVLCSLPRFEAFYLPSWRERPAGALEARKDKASELLRRLLRKPADEEEARHIKNLIKESNAPAKVRKDLILNLEKRNRVFEWAVADFIDKNYGFSDIFRGTSKCASLEQLSEIMLQNMAGEFSEFDRSESYAIMYYICRIEHEKHPENAAIELLRTKYLREKVI